MGINRIATYKTGAKMFEIEADGVTMTGMNSDASLDSVEKTDIEMRKKFPNEIADTIGFHKNQDGTICIWTGSPPAVFPEDEPKE